MTSKPAVRSQISAARAGLTPAQRVAGRSAIVRFVLTRLATLDLPAGSSVAAYEALPSEPGSPELLAALVSEGYRVLVPVTLPDRDLDWVEWGSEPVPLGVAAIADCRLVLVPAFAVDPRGNRLGRGGGSFDRVLARVAPGTPVVALLFDGELLDEVPTDDWDQPVSGAVTPDGWIDFTPGGRRNTR